MRRMRIPGARSMLPMLAALCGFSAGAADLSVVVAEGTLTIHSDGASLQDVLSSVSAQTGIELSMADEISSAAIPVVDDFSGLPVSEGIKRLLHKAHVKVSYSLITNDDTGDIEAIRILSTTRHPPTSPNVAAPSAELHNEQKAVEHFVTGELSVQEREAEALLAQAILAARTAIDPDAKIEALQRLGEFRDPRTVETLRSALYSDQADVRRAALAAIPWDEPVARSALAVVRTMALYDPEQEVRQAAAGVLVDHDASDPETQAVLKLVATIEKDTHGEFVQQEVDRMAEDVAPDDPE